MASIAFAALQVTALFLVTTPPEEMALAFRWFLAPLRLLGVPVQKLTMTLLLSLRFVSLVEESGVKGWGVRGSGTESCSPCRGVVR